MEINISPDVVIGISNVSDGNMSRNWGPEREVIVNSNRFLETLGIRYEECVRAKLEAGEKIMIVNKTDEGKTFDCDALITTESGVPLWLVTADCFPVVLFEPDKKILALAHLGRQGIDLRLGQKVIKEMAGMGATPEQMRVYVAPGISKESYKWKGKLPFRDPEWTDFTDMDQEGYWHIDGPGFIKKQLTDKGIMPENIQYSGIDVFTDKNYFSHVRSVNTGEKEGRFATAVVRKQNI